VYLHESEKESKCKGEGASQFCRIVLDTSDSPISRSNPPKQDESSRKTSFRLFHRTSRKNLENSFRPGRMTKNRTKQNNNNKKTFCGANQIVFQLIDKEFKITYMTVNVKIIGGGTSG